MSRKEIKSRVSSWKTTAIGFILMTVAIVSVFTHGVSWSEAIAPITIGLGFVMSKDSWIDSVIKMIILGLFVSCSPVKQVLKDQKKFDIIAKEVIKRNYCKADTVKIYKTKDSVVYKDSIVFKDVPCKDFDTTINRARIRVSSGVLTYSNSDSIVYRITTVTNNIRDLAKEEVLSSEVKERDSLIHSLELKIAGSEAKTLKEKIEANSWKLKFWGVISILVLLLSAKYLVRWPFLK